MSKSNYINITQFGCNSDVTNTVNDPLTYCLGFSGDQQFLHGSSAVRINGQSSKECQLYLSQYCAEKWDNFCELASQNTNISFPNNMDTLGLGDVACKGLNQGEVLIHNTARRKYLNCMLSNCEKKWVPFDPNVANSPMISYWVTSGQCGNSSCFSSGCGSSSFNTCVPVYTVDPSSINNDIVMNKILDKPYIAFDILVNIYNTMKRIGTLSQLRGTRLGNYYSSNKYFVSKGGL
jgi:hypothetical protein